MSQLGSVIKALGVERVVWIDDMFAPVATEKHSDSIQLAAEILKLGKLEDLGAADIREEEDQVAALAERLEGNEELLERAIAILGDASEVAQARQTLAKMGCAMEEATGTAWRSSLEAKNGSYVKTLFLVDRDFSNEGIASDQADALLRDTVNSYVVGAPSNYCIVFTKEVSVEAENETRVDFLEKLLGGKVKEEEAIRFSVISKNALNERDQAELSKKLRDKLAGVVLYSILEHVEDSLTRSMADIRKLLSSEFPDFTKAVLSNSYSEGASELDVLLRILQQKHRLAISESLDTSNGAKLTENLQRFRLFQLDAEVNDHRNNHKISGELTRLCRAEVLTEGPLINEMMLPLVPGDVFAEITPGRPKLADIKAWPRDLVAGKRYFMLLGQLCDMIPRSKDGASNASMGFLAPFSVVLAKDHDKPLDKKQIHSGRKGWMTVGDLALHFDFRDVVAANLTALQLCTFNRSGAAFLSEKGSQDKVWSLASVARARQRTLEYLTKNRQIPPEMRHYAAAFVSDDINRTIKVRGRSGERTFSYPIRRVCRIRDLEASEALGALERYWRRPAKPHYFAT